MSLMPSPSDAAAAKLTDLVHRARASVPLEAKPAVGRPVEPEPTIDAGGGSGLTRGNGADLTQLVVVGPLHGPVPWTFPSQHVSLI